MFRDCKKVKKPLFVDIRAVYRGDKGYLVWEFCCVLSADIPLKVKAFAKRDSRLLTDKAYLRRQVVYYESQGKGADYSGKAQVIERFYSIILSEEIRSFNLIIEDSSGVFSSGKISVSKLQARCLLHAHYQAIENAQADPLYPRWLETHLQQGYEEALQKLSLLQATQKFSIITPIYNTPKIFLQQLLESVFAQYYTNWELVLVNASPENRDVREVLERYQDEKVKIIEVSENKGIAGNTNIGIEAASGDYICFLDHDDMLEPHALYEYAQAVKNDPSIDLMYCDEDSIDEKNHPFNPLFKPSWNRDLFYSNNYILHFLSVSRRMVEATVRSGSRVEGAQDYDLALKTIELSENIKHIPKILYHWRSHSGSTNASPEAKPYTQLAGLYALEDHFYRRGVRAKGSKGEYPFTYKFDYTIPLENEDAVSALVRVRSLRAVELAIKLTQQERVEAHLILDKDTEIAEDDIHLFLSERREANNVHISVFSDDWGGLKAVNQTALKSEGSYLLFIDENVTPLSNEFVASMRGFFRREEVGVVAPKIFYEDGLVCYAGISLTPEGDILKFSENLPKWDGGMVGRVHRPCDYPATGKLCFMVRKTDFIKMEGFCPDFLDEYAVVDFCFRMNKGKSPLVVYDPYTIASCVVYSRENSAKNLILKSNSKNMLMKRWGDMLSREGFLNNKNLNPYSKYYQLNWDFVDRKIKFRDKIFKILSRFVH